MLLVYQAEPGVVELAWTWLPAWLGMNPSVKAKVEAHINEKYAGKEASLEELHAEVISFICSLFPTLRGLRQVLLAVEAIDGNEVGDGSA